MKVLKFGGASLANAERISNIRQIIEKQDDSCIIVISAFKSITDQLIEISELALAKNNLYKKRLQEIKELHLGLTNHLLPKDSDYNNIISQVNALLNKLENTLQGVFLLGDLSPRIKDYILSFGERLAALIVSKVIPGAVYLDSRKVIVANHNYGKADVNFQETNTLIIEQYDPRIKYLVVPGFIASTIDGITVTLGRGGSDYTAAIFAAALDAKILEIWTHVDGFMTADPGKVPKAIAIENLSYSEAMELSHFGAEVIYTPTIKPVFKKNIPIAIKNSFNPTAKGTLIGETKADDKNLIKGISSMDDVDLITLQGAGMVGVSGISMRLFGALARAGVNIILITQASSEYSISFAINPNDTAKAIASIESEFETEIKFRKEISFSVEKDLSIIAIVGEKMKNTPGISATLFQSLGRNGINIIAIAQGSSELNISVVIRQDELKKALNVIHEGFFLSHYKELHLYLVGVGLVGSSLIRQILNQQSKLLDEHRLKINLVGIARSRKMLISEDGIDLADCIDKLNTEGTESNLDDFVNQIQKLNLRNSVFIDCTADETVAKLYPEVLNTYSSIVTANKIACSSAFDFYSSLKKSAQDKGVKLFFETNVGAGLPIIGTIGDLIKSGDKITKLEAVLSGTLNFIFNVLSKDIPLSKAIKLAKEKGYSEPDPRVDLSGIDVTRKLLILAREAGHKLEREEISISPFLPSDCFEGTLDDFWKKVETFDVSFEEKRKKLEKENKKWRFVATFDNGKAYVQLNEVDINHPAYALEGSNNIILITTERYADEPMIIKGYGAGAEVTAAGVFADIIRVANI